MNAQGYRKKFSHLELLQHPRKAVPVRTMKFAISRDMIVGGLVACCSSESFENESLQFPTAN